MLNKERFLKNFTEISKFGALKGGGITRLAFSKEDEKARIFLLNLLKKEKFKIKIDEAGNIFAKFDEVKNPNLPSVAVGSHIDSVPKGGIYDGTLGVMMGLEILTSIKENKEKLNRPLELVIFACEESSRFKMATVGSKIVSGKLNLEKLKTLKDEDGISLFDAMIDFNLQAQNLQNAILEKNHFHSYIEAHIEQGRVLEEKQIPIGIVTGIAAPIRFELTIKGRADHSGATPMAFRKDALIYASKIILKAEEFAKENQNSVATVGYIRVVPGALNVVPGEVVMGFDIRDIDKNDLEKVNSNLRNYIEKLSKKEDFSYFIKELAHDEPVKLDDKIINLLEDSAKNLKIPSLKMPSGAGHDAMHMPIISKNTGMLFIPCKDGISHNIKEEIDFKDAYLAMEILNEALIKLAKE